MESKLGRLLIVSTLLLFVAFALVQLLASSRSESAESASDVPGEVAPATTASLPSVSVVESAASSSTTETTAQPQLTAEDVLEIAESAAAARGVLGVGAPVSPDQGCIGECPMLGFQDLSNQQGVTLENVTITNPGGRCLDLTGASEITVRNVTFVGCGTEEPTDGGYSTGMIAITDAQNITIENSIIRDISNEDFGSSRNNAIEIQDSSNITIRSSFIGDVRSDIEHKANDMGSRAIVIVGSSWDITVDGNRFYNAGRNAIQLSRVRGATGISITDNTIDGRARWDSDYEDMISLFSSSGTVDDPIRVLGNTMRNGGPSRTGTGIVLGDGDISSGPTEHVIVEANIMINPGHVGINLAGGNNILIANNIIVGIGEVPHPTTVGMTINDFGYSAECRDHVISGNQVWMENQFTPGGTNHLWNPGTCSDNVQLSENLFGS